MIIITKDKPFKTPHGDITYESLIRVKPDADGIYRINSWYTPKGIVKCHLTIKLVDNKEFDHGNGD